MAKPKKKKKASAKRGARWSARMQAAKKRKHGNAGHKKKSATKAKKTGSGLAAALQRAMAKFNEKKNPGLKRAKGKGTGWMRADRVRIVKKRGQPDRVLIWRKKR